MDIEIVLAVGIVAIVAALLISLRRKRKADQTPHPAVLLARSSGTTNHIPRPISYNPGVTVVETNSGFEEGMIIGSMMGAGNYSGDEATVEMHPIPDPPQFSGFGGGDSAGGGATSDWSSPDTSSCDTSSSDSGSCGGDSQ